MSDEGNFAKYVARLHIDAAKQSIQHADEEYVKFLDKHDDDPYNCEMLRLFLQSYTEILKVSIESNQKLIDDINMQETLRGNQYEQITVTLTPELTQEQINELYRILDQPTPPYGTQGCDYCLSALYAGTKCKNCGRITEPTTGESP